MICCTLSLSKGTANAWKEPSVDCLAGSFQCPAHWVPSIQGHLRHLWQNERGCHNVKWDFLFPDSHAFPDFSRSSAREIFSGLSLSGAMTNWLCSMRRSRSNSPCWIKARASTTRRWRTWEFSNLRLRNFAGKRGFLPGVWQMLMNSGNRRPFRAEGTVAWGELLKWPYVHACVSWKVFLKLYKIIFYMMKLLTNNENNFSIIQNLCCAHSMSQKNGLISIQGNVSEGKKIFLEMYSGFKKKKFENRPQTSYNAENNFPQWAV